jgi:D-amino peptidase
MVQGIDSSFDAAVFIGYHSAAGNGGNPLAHTISGRHFASVEINGTPASEFLVYAYAAASVGVPVAFLSGDKALCEEAAEQVGGLVCVATMEGQGASTISVSPADALHKIRQGVQRALEAPLPHPPELPSAFAVKIGFKNASDAYAKAFYPGASQLSARDVGFETDTYFEVLRFLWFMAQ